MHTPRKPRTIGSALPDVFLGAILSIISTPSLLIGGFMCHLIFVSLGVGEPVLFAIAATLVMGFVLAIAVGFGIGSFASTDPLALATGLGVAPLIVASLTATSTLGVPTREIAIGLVALAIVQGLGCCLGCSRSRPDKRTYKRQRGVGVACADCSYDLTATANGQPCPECGGMMRLTPETASALASASEPEPPERNPQGASVAQAAPRRIGGTRTVRVAPAALRTTIPATPRTFRSMLPDIALGVVVGGIVACASIVIGLCAFYALANFGSLAGVASFASLVLTMYLAHVGASIAGRGVGGLVPKDPLAFAMGTAGLPFLTVVAFSMLTSNPLFALFPMMPVIVLAAFIATGAYKGCLRTLKSKASARHGIGLTCAACAYDLTATAEGHPCPECGGMMRLTPIAERTFVPRAASSPSSSNPTGAS